MALDSKAKDAAFETSIPVYSKDGSYSVRGTTDNEGHYSIDNKLIFKSKDWRKIEKTSIEVTAGFHMIKLKGMNYGGKPTRNNPASLALVIRDEKANRVLDTASAYNWSKKKGGGNQGPQAKSILMVLKN